MGLKGQQDRFAEAHLSAPALFTHHLSSERRASQELSCSHNTTTPRIGGGDAEGSLWWSASSSVLPLLLFITCSSDKTCRQYLMSGEKRLGRERAFSLEELGVLALMLRIWRQFQKMKAWNSWKVPFKPTHVKTKIFIVKEKIWNAYRYRGKNSKWSKQTQRNTDCVCFLCAFDRKKIITNIN